MLLGGGDHLPQRRCGSGGSAGDRSQVCCQLLIVAGYFCPNGEAVNSSSACRAACSVGGWWRSAAGWQRPFCGPGRRRTAWTRGSSGPRSWGPSSSARSRRPPRAGPTRPSQQTTSTSRTPRSAGLGTYLGPERGAFLVFHPDAEHVLDALEIDADGQVGGTGEDLVVLADPGCGSRPGRSPGRALPAVGSARPAPPPGPRR